MNIKYKVVKRVFGFDKTNAVKYVARSVPITRMNRIDTDYTNGNAGGNGGDGDDNYIDPNA